jgi:ribulose-phosphate 3-epimerase
LSALLSPSILSADFARLADETARVAEVADMLHVDVMDGHFVPNLTIGPVVVESLRRHTDLTLDVHIMIDDPDRWALDYVSAGADILTFHAEATDDAVGVARSIREAGARAGLALRPGTPADSYLDDIAEFDLVLCMTVEPGFGGQAFMPEVLPKVRAVRDAITKAESATQLQVDGGINPETAGRCAEAGANVFVAGSAVFGAADPVGAGRAIKAAADAGWRE